MKKLLLSFLLLTSLSFASKDGPAKATKILDAATTTATGDVFQPWGPQRTFFAYGSTSAGSGASAIAIQASNDCTNYIDMGTISLTLGTTTVSDGFASDASWKCIRAKVNSISGTNAAVTVWMAN